MADLLTGQVVELQEERQRENAGMAQRSAAFEGDPDLDGRGGVALDLDHAGLVDGVVAEEDQRRVVLAVVARHDGAVVPGRRARELELDLEVLDRQLRVVALEPQQRVEREVVRGRVVDHVVELAGVAAGEELARYAVQRQVDDLLRRLVRGTGRGGRRGCSADGERALSTAQHDGGRERDGARNGKTAAYGQGDLTKKSGYVPEARLGSAARQQRPREAEGPTDITERSGRHGSRSPSCVHPPPIRRPIDPTLSPQGAFVPTLGQTRPPPERLTGHTALAEKRLSGTRS